MNFPPSGLIKLGHCTPALQLLNIAGCSSALLSPEVIQTLRHLCRRCVVEHSDPEFNC